MWESRGLCEISKSLWKPVCGFHGDVISTAVLTVVAHHHQPQQGDACTLAGWPIVVPGAADAVVFEPPALSTRVTRGCRRVERFYFVPSSVRKSVWTLVRQLRGPHLRTCA